MNQQLNQLLAQVGVTNAVGFVLVLARVTPLFVVAPLFSSSILPMQVRVVIAIGLTIGLLHPAVAGKHLPTGTLPIAGMVAVQLLIGLAFAMSIALLFAAIESAGTLLDGFVGFSFGSLVNPLSGVPGTILSQLYSMVGLAVFIAINGDAWVLQGIDRTFDLVPLTATPDVKVLASGPISTFGSIFASALEIGAPVLIAVVITDVGFGVVSRAVPQLNVFGVGFPVKIIVGLLLVSASMPFVAGWLNDQLTSSVAQALQTIRIG